MFVGLHGRMYIVRVMYLSLYCWVWEQAPWKSTISFLIYNTTTIIILSKIAIKTVSALCLETRTCWCRCKCENLVSDMEPICQMLGFAFTSQKGISGCCSHEVVLEWCMHAEKWKAISRCSIPPGLSSEFSYRINDLIHQTAYGTHRWLLGIQQTEKYIPLVKKHRCRALEHLCGLVSE